MKLESLHHLEAVARTGSITLAAEELSISQSSVSRSLRQLESELGIELFDRTRNHVELNVYGLLAAEYARSIMVEERRMVDAFNSINGKGRVLRVASCAPSPMVPFANFLNKAMPGTAFETTLVNAQGVRRRLLDRMADIAITNRPDVLPTITSVPFMNEEIYALIPMGNELATRSSVTFADLDAWPILLDKGAISWAEVIHAKMPSATFVEQTDLNVIIELTRSTDLITFANDYSPLFVGLEGRVRVPIDDPEARTTYYLQCLAESPMRLEELMEAARRAGVTDLT